MADSNFRGPISNMGAMEDTPFNVQPLDGPMYSYQGMAIANLRAVFEKDAVGAGRQSSFLNNPRVVTVDNIPSALTTTILAVAAAVTTSTPMTLVTIAPGGSAAGVPSVAPAVPIIPFGSTAVTTALALDFGFTTGTTAAGSGVISVPDTTFLTQGQWIVVGGAGNAAKTASLITQIQSIAATTITVLPAPAGTLNFAPIGGANLFNQFLPPATQFGPSAPLATAWNPGLIAGMLRVRNPLEMLARCVSVTGVATTNLGGAFLVSGWDVYGQAMTETITAAAGTASTFGQKTFKFIRSVVPQFADTATYSVGVGDTFGFPIRQDRWEQIEIMYNNARMVTNVGFTTADLTSPATATSDDVRGTVQLSASGANTAVAAPLLAASNGVRRLTIIQTLPAWNNIAGTPLNTVPMFGQTQV